MTNEFDPSSIAEARESGGDLSLTATKFFQPEPSDPTPETTSPASADRTGLARSRVKIEPVEDWVTVRDLDFSATAKVDACEMLLIDCQAHAGRHANYMRRVLRLATFDAVQQAAKWQLPFDPATEVVSIHYIRLRRASESLERANLEKMQFLQREEGLTGSEFIDGNITLLLILEDVRLGDVLDFAFTTVTTPRFLAHRYSGFWATTFQFSVREYRISVRFPTEVEMRWKSYPTDLPPAIRTVDAETEWIWEWTARGVPKIEPNTPWWHYQGGWVQVSTFASWEEIVAGIRASWDRSFDDEELERAARRIAASAVSTADCVEKAFTLVQDEIRYLSMNIDLGGQIPADPSITLRRRFGDCKDKSFLLAQLLCRLGHSARPVLTHTKLDRMLEKFLPSPNVFNHVVVEFDFEGRRRWLDATIDMQGGGVLARNVPHLRHGLPMGPGVAGIESLPKAGPAAPPYYGLCETFRFGAFGQPVRLKVVLTLRGADADEQRQRFHHRGAQAISVEREEWYGSLFPGAKRVRALEWNDDREKNELIMAEAFELPQAMRAIPSQGRVLFEHQPYLIRGMLSTPARTEPRRLPLALGSPRRMEHTIELEWAALPTAEGRRVRERNDYFLLSLEETRAMTRWSSRYDFELLSESLSPADLQRFEKHVGKIASALYVGVFGPQSTHASAKPWTGSLLPPPRRVSRPAGPSAPARRDTEAFAPPAPDSTLGIAIPEHPAEPLLSAPASAPSPGTGTARPNPNGPAKVKPARHIEPQIRSDSFTEPRRRRRRRRGSWPTAVKVVLFFLAIIVGFVVLSALVSYSVREIR